MSEATYTVRIDDYDRTWSDAVRGTKALEAKTRVNSTTLASKGIDDVKEMVKGKLYKQLLEQLMTSGCVTIESVRNAINGSVTFTAKVELLEPSKNNETITAKAA